MIINIENVVVVVDPTSAEQEEKLVFLVRGYAVDNASTGYEPVKEDLLEDLDNLHIPYKVYNNSNIINL